MSDALENVPHAVPLTREQATLLIEATLLLSDNIQKGRIADEFHLSSYDLNRLCALSDLRFMLDVATR